MANTSAYDSPDSLRLMDGVVDVYMPDLKLTSSELTRRHLGKREYFEIASGKPTAVDFDVPRSSLG